MHPVVEPGSVEQEFESPNRTNMSAVDEWIEDPDLDQGMRIERGDLLVARHCVAVVYQHAYAHAAVGCAHQSIGEQPAGFIAAKDEVLQVEGLLRGADHLRPRQKPIYTRSQDS